MGNFTTRAGGKQHVGSEGTLEHPQEGIVPQSRSEWIEIVKGNTIKVAKGPSPFIKCMRTKQINKHKNKKTKAKT